MVNQREKVVYAREGGFYLAFLIDRILTALVLSLRPLYILARNDLQYCTNAFIWEKSLRLYDQVQLELMFTGAAIVERQ